MFKCENLAEVYSIVGKELLSCGDSVSPRGEKTFEIISPVIHIENPRERLAYHKDRGFSVVYAITESLMLCSSKNDVKYFSLCNSKIQNFSDDGQTFHGCYGTRIAPQLDGIVDLLKSDKYTRQAMITIYNGGVDVDYRGKDTPCTTNLHFLIRNDKLNLIAEMRSNDIMTGTPYDIYNFTNLQEVIANTLGIDVGWYRHIPSSLHVYAPNVDMLYAMSGEDIQSVKCSNGYNLEAWREQANMYTDFVDNIAGEKFFDDAGKELNVIQNEILYKKFGKGSAVFDVPDWVSLFTKRWG